MKKEDVCFITATNSVMSAEKTKDGKEGSHYVTIFMAGLVDEAQGEPQVSPY